MKWRKIAYSAIALSKRRAIKRVVKEKHGQYVADRVSKHISEALSRLKNFPELRISMREQYDLDCDYYMLFVEKNMF